MRLRFFGSQVERYGPYTDRILSVISSTEIRAVRNEAMAPLRPYKLKIRHRTRHRIAVPDITKKYVPFMAPYEANLR
jgi:hypothetical protein